MLRVLIRSTSKGFKHMSQPMTKPTKWYVHPEKTDQPGHLLSLIKVFTMCSVGSYLVPNFLHADCEDSDQADLSLCWTHMSFCRFWRALAHICFLWRNKKIIHTFQLKKNFIWRYGILRQNVRHYTIQHILR